MARACSALMRSRSCSCSAINGHVRTHALQRAQRDDAGRQDSAPARSRFGQRLVGLLDCRAPRPPRTRHRLLERVDGGPMVGGDALAVDRVFFNESLEALVFGGCGLKSPLEGLQFVALGGLDVGEGPLMLGDQAIVCTLVLVALQRQLVLGRLNPRDQTALWPTCAPAASAAGPALHPAGFKGDQGLARLLDVSAASSRVRASDCWSVRRPPDGRRRCARGRPRVRRPEPGVFPVRPSQPEGAARSPPVPVCHRRQRHWLLPHAQPRARSSASRRRGRTHVLSAATPSGSARASSLELNESSSGPRQSAVGASSASTSRPA